jgi:hypothetical protein
VETGFPKRSCSNKKLERDADPTITRPALVELIGGLDQYGERDVYQMTVPHWFIGLAILALPAAFVVFAFRQGQKVKPDPNNRHGGGEWGGGDGHSGHDGHAG